MPNPPPLALPVPLPESTNSAYLLVHDLFNLKWFDDVTDKLRMYIRVTDLLVKKHAHGVLDGGKTQK